MNIPAFHYRKGKQVQRKRSSNKHTCTSRRHFTVNSRVARRIESWLSCSNYIPWGGVCLLHFAERCQTKKIFCYYCCYCSRLVFYYNIIISLFLLKILLFLFFILKKRKKKSHVLPKTACLLATCLLELNTFSRSIIFKNQIRYSRRLPEWQLTNWFPTFSFFKRSQGQKTFVLVFIWSWYSLFWRCHPFNGIKFRGN